MVILITGAAGFIGTNLALYHLRQNDQVIGIDNMYSSPQSNLATLKCNQNLRFIKSDINSFPFSSIKGPVDWIYNLACPASPPKYQKDPFFTIQTNTSGVFNVLELAKKKKAKILQASTSEVYGDPEIHPQPEEYRGCVNTLGPRACYDEGKRIAETICYEYSRQYNVKVKIARIFNTYGPYMSPEDGRVITNFIDQALTGKTLTVYGDGNQTRSFQYIDDLLEGFIKLMSTSAKDFGPYNMGNPDEFTINELAKTVLKITGSNSKITYQPLPKDDPKKRRPDISKAKQDLDWKPRVNLSEGLKKHIEWYKARV